MKKIKLLTLAVIGTLGMAFALHAPQAYAGSPQPTGNVNPQQEICEGSGGTWAGGKCTTPGQTKTLGDRVKDIVNILLFVLGAIAVIVIVIGGIRYALSGGDSSQVSAAKNTILYAVVGLVVAILAYSIVNFVLGAF